MILLLNIHNPFIVILVLAIAGACAVMAKSANDDDFTPPNAQPR